MVTPPEMATPGPVSVILIGPPGAGKGTQGRRLAEQFGLVHLSPGRILRETAATDSPEADRIRAVMAAGELVPSELVDSLVRERLQALTADRGFVLDGYPRTAEEARALRTTLARLGRSEPRPVVIWLDVARDELLARLRRRRGQEQRPDDSDEAVARRLEVYGREAPALRDALSGWTETIMVDGGQPPDAVAAQIAGVVRRARPRA
jgi:adenylate kinase